MTEILTVWYVYISGIQIKMWMLQVIRLQGLLKPGHFNQHSAIKFVVLLEMKSLDRWNIFKKMVTFYYM